MLLHQEQRQTVTQRIDPKIILANNILQLTTVELIQTVENELLENPALDTIEETGCDGTCVDPSSCPYCAARLHRAGDSDHTTESLDTSESDDGYDTYFGREGAEAEEDYDPVGNLEAEMTLQEHLRGLLRAAVPAEDYLVGEYIIDSLDEKGWLGTTPEAIAQEICVPEETVCRVLAIVQGFDPPGVGARDLQECLALQIQYLREEEKDEEKQKTLDVALRIVRDHYDLMSPPRYSKIARQVKISQDEAKQTLEYIRTRLHPYPASQYRPPWAYRPTNTRASVRPDVVVRRTELGYEVEVIGGEPFGLIVNPFWRDVYNQTKGAGHRQADESSKQVTEYVERAERFIQNINQRRQTLRQITRCIVDCQTGFIETGSRQFLRPLTRTRIARMLNIHESTVSRATSNKFVQLPNQEVVSFDVFFNSSLPIKDVIEDIISSEDPANPLSDQQIAEMLREKGVDISRRTIVKYRDTLKLLSSTRRRR